MRWLLLALGFFASGCYGAGTVLDVDDGFDDTQLAAMQTAADEWCSAGATECYTFSRSHGHNPHVRMVTTPDDCGDTVNAHVLLSPMHFEINPQCDVRRTMLHELGHEYGMSHLDPGTIMAPYNTEQSANLTTADINACRDAGGCR
jgi:hypothetical protein